MFEKQPPQKLRHAAIAEHLRAAIQAGHFNVGDSLPSELDLAAHYKTSRHSIRVALEKLEGMGLIRRRKKAGTRVLSQMPMSNFQLSYASMDDLTNFGAQHSRVVQEVKTISASASLAQLLGCPVLDAWLCISSLRLDKSAEPIGWTNVYVSPFFGGLEDLIKARPEILVSTLLEEHYAQSIASVEQTVCAVMLSAQMAKRLHVQPESAGLRVIRRYLDAKGRAVEISVSFHPAERFSMSTELKRTA